MGAKIRHITYKLPDTCVTNKDLAAQFPDTTEEYIFRKTGIKKRYVLSQEQIPSDLALEAINEFFEKTKTKKEEIDFLIFCSEGFDYRAGITSAILQHKAGFSKNIGVLDLPQGCTGYIYGLMIAKSIISSGVAKNVLLVTCDLATKVLHPEDLELRSIFADAATVTLISIAEEENTGEFILGTDGEGAHLLYVESSASRNPIDYNWVEKYKNQNGLKWGRMHMDSMEIFLFTLRIIPGLIKDVIEKNKLEFAEIDLFVFHQANGFMLKQLRKKTGIPEEKFFNYIEEVGNTVSSTIPICLAEAQKQGVIRPGMNILLAGFGIGLCWGATIIKT